MIFENMIIELWEGMRENFCKIENEKNYQQHMTRYSTSYSISLIIRSVTELQFRHSLEAEYSIKALHYRRRSKKLEECTAGWFMFSLVANLVR